MLIHQALLYQSLHIDLLEHIAAAVQDFWHVVDQLLDKLLLLLVILLVDDWLILLLLRLLIGGVIVPTLAFLFHSVYNNMVELVQQLVGVDLNVDAFNEQVVVLVLHDNVCLVQEVLHVRVDIKIKGDIL